MPIADARNSGYSSDDSDSSDGQASDLAQFDARVSVPYLPGESELPIESILLKTRLLMMVSLALVILLTTLRGETAAHQSKPF